MDRRKRHLVRQQAQERCEYCQLPQAAAPFLAFHIEHIIAAQHGGTDELDNLALACPDCNRHKGPNLTSIDPMSGDIVALFHPRQHDWGEHFLIDAAAIEGRTDIGRATARLLRFNDPERISMRRALQANQEWPL